MEEKIVPLKAKQSSEIAHITQLSSIKSSFWCYYTHSQGGTKWDPRRFASAEKADRAARAAGFQIKRNF